MAKRKSRDDGFSCRLTSDIWHLTSESPSVCKPGSVVSDPRKRTAIHLGRLSPGASSDQPEPACHGENGVFLAENCGSYAVLLQVGLAMPPLLPRTRCALTAPFHPYPSAASPRRRFQRKGRDAAEGRFVFCGAFPWVSPAGRYPAPFRLKPGLSSPHPKREQSGRPTDGEAGILS